MELVGRNVTRVFKRLLPKASHLGAKDPLHYPPEGVFPIW